MHALLLLAGITLILRVADRDRRGLWSAATLALGVASYFLIPDGGLFVALLIGFYFVESWAYHIQQ